MLRSDKMRFFSTDTVDSIASNRTEMLPSVAAPSVESDATRATQPGRQSGGSSNSQIQLLLAFKFLLLPHQIIDFDLEKVVEQHLFDITP